MCGSAIDERSAEQEDDGSAPKPAEARPASPAFLSQSKRRDTRNRAVTRKYPGTSRVASRARTQTHDGVRPRPGDASPHAQQVAHTTPAATQMRTCASIVQLAWDCSRRWSSSTTAARRSITFRWASRTKEIGRADFKRGLRAAALGAGRCDRRRSAANESPARQYLPPICSGDTVAALAVTEPGADTAQHALQARRDRDFNLPADGERPISALRHGGDSAHGNARAGCARSERLPAGACRAPALTALSRPSGDSPPKLEGGACASRRAEGAGFGASDAGVRLQPLAHRPDVHRGRPSRASTKPSNT